MLWIAFASLLVGVAGGCLVFPPEAIALMDGLAPMALKLLIFAVGIQIGADGEVWGKIKEQGLRILLVPGGVIVGSIMSGILAGMLMGVERNISAAISSGMGWYSISGALLKEPAGAQVATTAFLTNIFREVLSIAVIPFVAKYMGNYAAIAPAGATAMDTTLPIITSCTDDSTAVAAVITGLLCSTAVPLLVPLMFNLL